MGFPKSQEAAVEQSRNWRKGQRPGLASSLVLSLRWGPALPTRSRRALGPYSQRRLPPSTPMLLRQLQKLSRAQWPSVPVSWGLGRTSIGLAEGTEGLCFPSSPLVPCHVPRPTLPWEPESAPLSGPRATPQELSRGLLVPVAGEPSPRLCVMPRPEAWHQSPGQSRTFLWSQRESQTVAPLGAG